MLPKKSMLIYTVLYIYIVLLFRKITAGEAHTLKLLLYCQFEVLGKFIRRFFYPKKLAQCASSSLPNMVTLHSFFKAVPLKEISSKSPTFEVRFHIERWKYSWWHWFESSQIVISSSYFYFLITLQDWNLLDKNLASL